MLVIQKMMWEKNAKEIEIKIILYHKQQSAGRKWFGPRLAVTPAGARGGVSRLSGMGALILIEMWIGLQRSNVCNDNKLCYFMGSEPVAYTEHKPCVIICSIEM